VWRALSVPDVHDSLSIDMHPAVDGRIRQPVEHEPVREQDAHGDSDVVGLLLDIED
jgi:hypothetical protein